MNVRKALLNVCLVAIASAVLPAATRASVESRVQKTVSLEASPLDVATSADGKWLFVLLQGGEVLIYSADGELKGRIRGKENADGIASSPTGDRIFLTSRAGKALEIVSVEFVQAIDVTGSPFKGPADAPVVVAVFDDFQ